MENKNRREELISPLISSEENNYSIIIKNQDEEGWREVGLRTWEESKKLWHIAGPSIISRIASFSMNVITTAFAGHLGDLELASLAIANTVIVGFNFGLLNCRRNKMHRMDVFVLSHCPVNKSKGMASALETLCGQAFGAKQLHMLGIYMQRSWIVLFFCCFLLLPFYVFATPLLKLAGEPDDVAEQSGIVAMWLIPLHFSFAFVFPVQRFLQSQLKTAIIAWVSFGAFLNHLLMSWLLVYVFNMGIIGLCIALNISWWILFFGEMVYVVWGGCPDTWTGISYQAFSGLWEFVKLSAASGVMLCLENWYYRILVLMVGGLKNAAIAVDALSVCMTINGWEMMIPLAFFAATGVRVANELGAGNGKAAKFATKVSVTTSTIIGLFFCVLIMALHDKFAFIFSDSAPVLEEVDKLSWLLAVTILLNSVQPVLSGVAVGSGWQSWVAYINIGCYYVVGLPLGIAMGWFFNTGVVGIWAGMIFGGTALQTLILGIATILCDWENEAQKVVAHVQKWSSLQPQ